MKFVLISLGLAISGLCLTGCNTVQGVGQDLAAGGHALSNAASSVKQSASHRHKKVITRPAPEETTVSSTQ